jgi:hypothetical protein
MAGGRLVNRGLGYRGSLAPSTSIGSIASGASVDEVAARVGYADGVTLRALLRRRLQVGIKEIRRTA